MALKDPSWPDPRISASRSVLVEVMTILASEVDRVVLVGGWVPELLVPGRGHIGSLDVDLALDGRKIHAAAYDSIRKRLLAAHDEPVAPTGSIFIRHVAAVGHIPVRLDLMTGEGTTPREQEPHTLIQGMVVGKLRGTDLALDHAVQVTLRGTLPDGSVNDVRLRIADVAAFLCMKAHALGERKREKDAYDLYFCLRACEGGPSALARTIAPLRGKPLVDQAIDILREKFSALNRTGPQWSVQVASEHGERFDLVARDAFERMNAFLSALEGGS